MIQKLPYHDVVLIIDFDLSSLNFASPQAFKNSIKMVASLKWHALCSNGHQGSDDGLAYDTFATVLDDGTFPYFRDNKKNTEKELRLIPEALPFENLSLLIDGPRGFTQKNLTDYINDQKTPLPVISCFGGATLYNWKVLTQTTCNYTYQRSDFYPFRFFNEYDSMECEHVTFHKCLSGLSGVRYRKNLFIIGINSQMYTIWHARFHG